MLKKVIPVMLSAAMLCSTVPVFAQNQISTDVTAVLNPYETAYKSYLSSPLTVTELGDDFIVASIDSKQKLQLNITDETVIIDSELAVPLSVKEIKAGDEIFAEYSPNMTKSVPAQTNASFIAVNTDKGGGVSLITAYEVNKNDNGDIVVTDKSRDILLTISNDAGVKPYKTKNIVKVDDIKAGSVLLAWYDITTLSLPAQAYTEKVVLLSERGPVFDQAPSTWAEQYIKDALTLGIVETIDEDWTADITRRHFCDLAYNMLNQIKELPVEKLAKAPFDDVNDPKVFAMASAGIINGKGDRIFAPEDKLTRQEAATILYRIAEYAGIEMPTVKVDVAYADNADIAGWAAPAVHSLNALNIMTGTNKGFEPKANFTVEQSIATLMRAYDYII